MLLRRRDTRLLTLTGPAGAGKTRLALEYARRRGPGGVPVLVELAGLAEGADPVQAVAAALGVGESGGRVGVEALVHALGGHRVLLLVDNCEHVVDGCARLVGTLLERCPGLRVLATSREALRVPGEVVLRIGALDQGPRAERPAGPGATAAPAASDAVRLFVDRATASAPGFAAVGADVVTVGEICHRLDGLPLAIELAARRVVSLPLGAILAGLDDQLALLTGGSRTGPARHLDLAAAISWSHRLLEAPARALLRRVSVLRGGFDADAATAVAADGPDGVLPVRRILPVLLELEAKSLLVRAPAASPQEACSPAGRGAGHSAVREAGSVRFRQLEAVRAYALERLEESGEAARTQRRAVAWLAGLVGPTPDSLYCAVHLPGPVLAERENLAAAIAAASTPAGAPGGPPPVLVLALAGIRYDQGQLSAARAVLEAGPTWPDDRLQAARLALTARITTWQGDTETALGSAERAVTLARSLDHPALLAGALGARARARLTRREISQAVDDYRARAAALTHLDRPMELAWAQHQLAWALLQAGCPAEADALLTGCLPALREHAPPLLLCSALHPAGAVRLRLQDWPTAQDLFVESLRAEPVESWGVYSIEGLAAVAAAQGEYERAVRLFTAAARTRARLEGEVEPGWQDQIAPFQARAADGLSPAAGAAARASGSRFTWAELVADALGEAACDTTQVSPTGPLGPLTARERVVAEMVAQGLTDRQIGANLKVSHRTVATHLNRARTKLGIRSRSEIAVWISGQRTAHV